MGVQEEHTQAAVVRPSVIRPGRAAVRTTYQLVADVLPHEDAGLEQTVPAMQRVVLDWAAEKLPYELPGEGYVGEPFERDEQGQKVVAVPVPEEGIWAFRLEQPDAPFMGRSAVAGRTWTTDIALRREGETLRLGVRVQCASLAYAQDPISMSRPRVVKDLAQIATLRETRPLDGRPWRLESFEDLRAFEAFLLDEARTMPVVLLTQPDRNRLHVGVSDFLLDPDWLGDRLLGLGYVATMPRDLGYHWTDLVGKPWSAFLGAVRTYMPGMDYEKDSPQMHPLTFADKIVLWRYEDARGENKGERAFERFLVDKARAYAASKQVDWKDCVFTPQARQIRAALARSHTQDEAEWRELFEQEITALREQLEEQKAETEASLELAANAEKDRDYYREANARLRAHNETLRAQLGASAEVGNDEEAALPTEYEDIPEWVEQRFAGRLELHPRAARALKGADYEEVERVCRGLDLLAIEYRNMRMGHDGAQKVWQKRLMEQGLEFSGAITENRAGEEGDTYFVHYPPQSPNRRLLEFHLRRGNSREAKHCLRIYFFWDDETQQVVVGSLPAHLETRST